MTARPDPSLGPQPWLKVCGLRTPEQAYAVAALGVDAIGVIGVESSPRWLAQDARPALFSAVRQASSRCLGVLVVADPTDQDVPVLGPAGGHQVLQLHGQETPERCLQLRQALGPDLLLWKALRIRQPDDLQRAADYGAVVDGLLLDAWVPDQLGGTGHRIPIEWLSGFQPTLPWWLAGGLNPDRIAPALQALQHQPPSGLDVSSGVERAPGDKDLAKVQQLVAALAPFRQDLSN
ncbi:phosphoribosylanthranilate isomerase [Synechococcus sp. A10-1-5-1]|uniref:phosphoribosylanthranilate isomerase n=1 Tax=Synechococcus sp. A10-1-5-1 TaxID=2936507 RepID=UPI00200078C6|nr:phosphoribosylanthranilate isomerase [Synechococcus sp. A10-1-5-1]UPM50277.1 phosphoribosylanthranilate isomerase [Synechococcus sp. A10-1-5-1]